MQKAMFCSGAMINIKMRLLVSQDYLKSYSGLELQSCVGIFPA